MSTFNTSIVPELSFKLATLQVPKILLTLQQNSVLYTPYIIFTYEQRSSKVDVNLQFTLTRKLKMTTNEQA